jgi:hypothetical protein
MSADDPKLKDCGLPALDFPVRLTPLMARGTFS